VGKGIVVGGEDEVEFRVVGVLEDVRTRPGRNVSPHVFHTLANAPWREMELMVRTRGDAASLAPALRSVVRELDPGLPVTSLRTMEALSSSNLATPRSTPHSSQGSR